VLTYASPVITAARAAQNTPGPDLIATAAIIILAGLYGLVRGPGTGHRAVAVLGILIAVALLVHWKVF